ncbi:MAG: hypothetical protein U1E62_16025 [Alsobacter sp.]
MLGLGVAAACTGPAAAPFAIVPLVGLWAVAGWWVNAPQGSCLAGLAPDAPSVALSLNAAALYVGTAADAVLGSLTTHYGEPWQLGLVAAGLRGRGAARPGGDAPTASEAFARHFGRAGQRSAVSDPELIQTM